MSHKDLTQEDLESLKLFNMRLKKLQDVLINEASRLDTHLRARVADASDILQDYEIELLVQFYLKDDDAFVEDEDNLLTTIDEYLKNISTELQSDASWRWSTNNNDFRGKHFSSHPMVDEYHCWWFHCLYDHNKIDFKDMLRIGEIHNDIKVYYQYVD
ncbi:MAG: hypothetical protein PHH41_03620 [Sulfurimonas sp.]|nr:hypothetical protein [Sulfurimonas sp.]MDD5202213.1 hypothetical protein [Sulfurimonas sp.]